MPPCSLGAHPSSPSSCVSDGLVSSPRHPTSPWDGHSSLGWLPCSGPGLHRRPVWGIRAAGWVGHDWLGFQRSARSTSPRGPRVLVLGQGRCPSDPDPLQRGPCLRSCPSACAALSDLGPCLWGCPPPEGSGWLGAWGSLARCVPPVTGSAWPSAGRGSSCLCAWAEWLTSCWPTGPRAVLRPACPSRVCSSRLLWGSRLRLAQFGPVSRGCLACVYHLAGGQWVSFQPPLLSPWLPCATLHLLLSFLLNHYSCVLIANNKNSLVGVSSSYISVRS